MFFSFFFFFLTNTRLFVLKPSMMFEMRDLGGELLFNQIQLRMVCEDCKAGPNPADCTHMKHLLPKWKSGAKQGKIIHFIIFFPQASLYTLTLIFSRHGSANLRREFC